MRHWQKQKPIVHVPSQHASRIRSGWEITCHTGISMCLRHLLCVGHEACRKHARICHFYSLPSVSSTVRYVTLSFSGSRRHRCEFSFWNVVLSVDFHKPPLCSLPQLCVLLQWCCRVKYQLSHFLTRTSEGSILLFSVGSHEDRYSSRPKVEWVCTAWDSLKARPSEPIRKEAKTIADCAGRLVILPQSSD